MSALLLSAAIWRPISRYVRRGGPGKPGDTYMSRRDNFRFEPHEIPDPRVRRDLPRQLIENYVREARAQFARGQITRQTCDDAERLLWGHALHHDLETDASRWIEAPPEVRQQAWDYQRGLKLRPNETPEAIAARQQLALDRVTLNAGYRLADNDARNEPAFNSLAEEKAPEVYRAVRNRIGLGETVGIDGQLRPLANAEEHLATARALAKVERGEEVEAVAPRAEPAPRPQNFPRDEMS